jgi:hypothetical protein
VQPQWPAIWAGFVKAVFPFIPPPLRFSPSNVDFAKAGRALKEGTKTIGKFATRQRVTKFLVFLAACFVARETGTETIFLIFGGFYLVSAALTC